MSWLVWGILILVQNAAFVANSRARNSASLSYHAVTNLCSNGIWILSQFFLIDKVGRALNSGDLSMGLGITGMYIILNLIGGLVSHHLLLKRSL